MMKEGREHREPKVARQFIDGQFKDIDFRHGRSMQQNEEAFHKGQTVMKDPRQKLLAETGRQPSRRHSADNPDPVGQDDSCTDMYAKEDASIISELSGGTSLTRTTAKSCPPSTGLDYQTHLKMVREKFASSRTLPSSAQAPVRSISLSPPRSISRPADKTTTAEHPVFSTAAYQAHLQLVRNKFAQNSSPPPPTNTTLSLTPLSSKFEEYQRRRRPQDDDNDDNKSRSSRRRQDDAGRPQTSSSPKQRHHRHSSSEHPPSSASSQASRRRHHTKHREERAHSPRRPERNDPLSDRKSRSEHNELRVRSSPKQLSSPKRSGSPKRPSDPLRTVTSHSEPPPPPSRSPASTHSPRHRSGVKSSSPSVKRPTSPKRLRAPKAPRDDGGSRSTSGPTRSTNGPDSEASHRSHPPSSSRHSSSPRTTTSKTRSSNQSPQRSRNAHPPHGARDEHRHNTASTTRARRSSTSRIATRGGEEAAETRSLSRHHSSRTRNSRRRSSTSNIIKEGTSSRSTTHEQGKSALERHVKKSRSRRQSDGQKPHSSASTATSRRRKKRSSVTSPRPSQPSTSNQST